MFACCYKEEDDEGVSKTYRQKRQQVKVASDGAEAYKMAVTALDDIDNELSIKDLKEKLVKTNRILRKVVRNVDIDEFELGDVFFVLANDYFRPGVYKKTAERDATLIYPGINKPDAYIIIPQEGDSYLWAVEGKYFTKIEDINKIPLELNWQSIELLV